MITRVIGVDEGHNVWKLGDAYGRLGHAYETVAIEPLVFGVSNGWRLLELWFAECGKRKLVATTWQPTFFAFEGVGRQRDRASLGRVDSAPVEFDSGAPQSSERLVGNDHIVLFGLWMPDALHESGRATVDLFVATGHRDERSTWADLNEGARTLFQDRVDAGGKEHGFADLVCPETRLLGLIIFEPGARNVRDDRHLWWHPRGVCQDLFELLGSGFHHFRVKRVRRPQLGDRNVIGREALHICVDLRCWAGDDGELWSVGRCDTK